MSLNVSVDIGSNSIKLVSLKKGRKGLLLEHFVHFPYKQLPSLSTDPSVTVFSQALRWLFEQNHIKKANVSLSFSSSEIYSKYISLPPTSEDQIKRILFFEAKKELPFPLEELTWDYHSLGQLSKKDYQTVVLFAMKNKFLSQALEAIREVSCSVKRVGVGSMALYNLAFYNRISPGSFVVDIGKVQTTVLIVDEGHFWTRTFRMGGDRLSTALASWMGVEQDVAERFQEKVGFQGEGSDLQRSNVLSKEFFFIVQEIEKIKEHYKTLQSSFTLKKIYLTGGLSCLSGVVDLVEKHFHVESDVLDPFQNLDIAHSLDYKKIQKLRYFFGTAVGLSLHGIKKIFLPVSVNLIPDNVYREKYQTRLAFSLFVVSFFIIVFWTFFFHGFRKNFQQLFSVNQMAIKELGFLKRKKETMQTLLADIKVLKGQLTCLSDIFEQRSSLFGTLLDFNIVTGKNCHYTLIQRGFSENDKSILENTKDLREWQNFQKSSNVFDISQEKPFFSLKSEEWVLRGNFEGSFETMDAMVTSLQSYPSVEDCAFQFAEEKQDGENLMISFGLKVIGKKANV